MATAMAYLEFPRLALRNLARNRRRSLLSLLIIAVGAAALLLTAGFMRFSFIGLQNAVIRAGLGHLEVVPAADVDQLGAMDRTAPPRLLDWERLRATLETVPHVRAVSGAIPLHGLATRDDKTMAFVGVGLEPEREDRMGFVLRLRGGSPLPLEAPAEGEDLALIGMGLARLLAVNVGDLITLTVLSEDRTLNAMDVRIGGLVTTGMADLDSRFLKIHLTTAQRLLATEAVSSLVVGLDDTSRTEAARHAILGRIRSAEPPLSVADWEQRAPYYGQVRSLYGGMFYFLGTIVFALVSLAVSNTLLMSVLERVREFGTLLAIGTSRAQLVSLIVLEAFWLGILGSTLGSALGLGLGASLNASGIRMPPPPGAAEGILLRLRMDVADHVVVWGIMLGVSLAAAAVPAIRSARLAVVEALSHS